MKILCFNHHPDVLHYMWRAFTELGHDVSVATEGLCKQIGFPYSSTKDNKFEVVDQLFEPGVLFPDMKDVKFMTDKDVNTVDLYWSMLPEITSLSKWKLNTWFDGQMQVYLRDKVYSAMPGIKTANHPDAKALNNFDFVPNWVDKQPNLIEKKFITQLITECDKVNFTSELIDLKKDGHPVRIYGGRKCPDGFIRDINILPYTSMLVHDKQFGVNCYAVCKALDMGIPVYMSRETRQMIGFGDLPDDCFLFSNENTILEAYGKSKVIDNKNIQAIYRSIYTLDRVKEAVSKLI